MTNDVLYSHITLLWSYFFCLARGGCNLRKEKGVHSSSSSSIISRRSWMSADRVLAAPFAVPLVFTLVCLFHYMPAVMLPDQESKKMESIFANELVVVDDASRWLCGSVYCIKSQV
eukprot:scaffold126754_cov35-Attheya_sp.AAC.1